MILRQAYDIVEEAKRAMAGKPKAEAERIRKEAVSKFREICESNSKSPTDAKKASES